VAATLHASAPPAVRLVALFEALKGLVVLLAATGLLSLVHQDVHAIAARLIAHAHLDPASRYPQILLDAARNLSDSRLAVLALGAIAYTALRLVEAYGLLRQRAWAELLAAGSGAIYLPFEVAEAVRHVSALTVTLLLANAAVVAVMVLALWRRRARRAAPGENHADPQPATLTRKR
jgi:uncharacterized membrane protein (DUF2068 family)